MTKKLESRALDRGLTIMEVLARSGSCTLADLSRTSGLPKSTIRRLLGTLIERRFVRRSLSDRRYRINITLPERTGEPLPESLAFLVDAALPHALDLTKAVGWPSDIHALDRNASLVVDSTRPASPYPLYSGVVNRRVSLFASAGGMACLSCMTDAEIGAYHDKTANDRKWGLARFGLSLDDYLSMVRTARKLGFGFRLPGYLGETVQDDGLFAIAVAIKRNGRPVGALTLIWPRAYASPEDFSATFFEPLRATVDAIDRSMQS